MNENRVTILMNPPDLLIRMRKYPKQLQQEMKHTTKQALYHVWGSVPPYPQQNPSSSYARTGTLGRTLGSNERGGRSGGKPDIMEIRQIGGVHVEGRFGTRLHYAPYVIGTHTQAKHVKRSASWWTMEDVKKAATDGIQRLFDAMGQRLVNWLVKQ